ncbi:MAG: polymer-forming cytoskeletal protein [Tepidanaerobacteraceae bacterium]|nr:polymer-forming cytoskeletal protein [Tepidanaerobacteraceae bacterium]
MFGRRSEPTTMTVDKVDTILGKSAEFSGKIKSSGILRIEGSFEGEIECEQDLIITEDGRVNADLKARHAVIAGTYQGNILLQGKLEIKNSGKVTGDVKVGTLVIEDGAIFDGKCEMNSEGQEKNLKLVKKERKMEASNPT